MLQLEPAKRIPLSKVLEHRWMQGVKSEVQSTTSTMGGASNEIMLWNSDILATIQKMNYDVERCKQVSLRHGQFVLVLMNCPTVFWATCWCYSTLIIV